MSGGDAVTGIPRHQRLGFRMGVALFVGLFAVNLLTVPLWNWLYWTLTPEALEPTSLRWYAAEIEAMTPEEIAGLKWDLSFLESGDYPIVVGVTALYAALFATILAVVVSRLATKRVRRLTREVSTPVASTDSVPGPFHAEGHDEIAVLGETMNRMRDEIVRLVAQLESRDRDRRQWIAEVSHDLRTPLTALVVSLDRARPLAKELGAENRDGLEPILESARFDARRVQDLAEDLLEIARLDAGDELAREPVPPGQLLRDAVGELQPVAEDEGIELTLTLAPDLPELFADGRRLIRALENLLLNSIQYAQSSVVVEGRVDASELVIEVRDDGPGLPETEGRVVLDDLRRHLKRSDSAGIGLEVAQKIVAAHGGRLSAANRPDGGASVEMRLPADG